jgi:hypothetical protein
MVLSHLGVSFLEEQHRLLTEKGPGHLWFCAPTSIGKIGACFHVYSVGVVGPLPRLSRVT